MNDKEFNILVIEDNPDDLVLLREMLAETQFKYSSIQWVDRMESAREYLSEQTADVALLDITLPDSRGIDTVRLFRRIAPYLPVIVLTGHDNMELGSRAIHEGAQDYLCKNDVNEILLENAIRFAMERHQLHTQLQDKRNRLAVEEQRFRDMLEKNADGILIVDNQHRVTFINPQAHRLLGPETHDRVDELLTGTMVYDDSVEREIHREDGATVVVELRMVQIDWQGAPAYLISLRDISERKQLETSIEIEKERLAITLDSIGDGVITTDRDGHILSVNRAAGNMIDRPKESVFGHHITSILNIANCGGDNREEGEPSPDSGNIYKFTHGMSIIEPKGEKEETVIEYSCAPISTRGSNISGHVFVIRDVTTRKKMTEEMLKVKKLDSLGGVASKLAHEYDNALTVILGNTSIARQRVTQLPAAKKIARMLDKVEKSTTRARELTDLLHDFSQEGKPSAKGGSPLHLLKDITRQLITSPLVACRWDSPDDLWAAEFDQEQLYTALWNIVKNAVEAMPAGGAIDIRLENVIVTEKMYLPLNHGSYVRICITDTGKGMAPEVLGKIFDPFFTLKPNTTGMGLTTAFSIVRKHQGTIDITSEIGAGSTVNVYLPAAVSSTGGAKEKKRKNRGGPHE